ncbi:MAG: MarR family winged helix-turn-helix transcriptional regulator [Marmoricola sp.]
MPTDTEYQRLLAFRTRLRRFDQWSRRAAEEHGLTHAQHQLLLAVRGYDGPLGPTIGDVAEALLVKHHTATGLVDRAQQSGLVERLRDDEDSRRVHLRLTPRGEEVLRELTAVHVEELRRLGPLLRIADPAPPRAAHGDG